MRINSKGNEGIRNNNSKLGFRSAKRSIDVADKYFNSTGGTHFSTNAPNTTNATINHIKFNATSTMDRDLGFTSPQT